MYLNVCVAFRKFWISRLNLVIKRFCHLQPIRIFLSQKFFAFSGQPEKENFETFLRDVFIMKNFHTITTYSGF